jgi:hypothetical protein
MLVYMDLCCFNRPFDDQSQPRIYLETEAKLFIQRKIKDGKLELAWSYILDYENSANPDIDAKNSIYLWRSIAARTIIASPTIVADASRFQEAEFGIKDSLHIACALECKADFFMTVDKGILAKRTSVIGLKIINPIEFISSEA